MNYFEGNRELLSVLRIQHKWGEVASIKTNVQATNKNKPKKATLNRGKQKFVHYQQVRGALACHLFHLDLDKIAINNSISLNFFDLYNTDSSVVTIIRRDRITCAHKSNKTKHRHESWKQKFYLPRNEDLLSSEIILFVRSAKVVFGFAFRPSLTCTALGDSLTSLLDRSCFSSSEISLSVFSTKAIRLCTKTSETNRTTMHEIMQAIAYGVRGVSLK